MIKPKQPKAALLFFAASFFVTGCEHLPSLNVLGPNYRPMTSDVAEIAAPLDPNIGAGMRPVLCRIKGGAAQFETALKDFSPADFAVWPKMRTNVTLSAVGFFSSGTFSFQAYFDDEGQKMIFCPLVQGALDKKVACSSLYALEEDFEEGIKRTFDIPKMVQGGQITCAYSKNAFKN